MSGPVWWTCGCGQRQKTATLGRPFCIDCGKQASFTVAAPVGQTGFGFGRDGESEPATATATATADTGVLRCAQDDDGLGSGR